MGGRAEHTFSYLLFKILKILVGGGGLIPIGNGGKVYKRTLSCGVYEPFIFVSRKHSWC